MGGQTAGGNSGFANNNFTNSGFANNNGATGSSGFGCSNGFASGNGNATNSGLANNGYVMVTLASPTTRMEPTALATPAGTTLGSARVSRCPPTQSDGATAWKKPQPDSPTTPNPRVTTGPGTRSTRRDWPISGAMGRAQQQRGLAQQQQYPPSPALQGLRPRPGLGFA